MNENGIVCGADAAQEWLLDWWWRRYKQWNDFPVAFADFGMTEQAKQWCRERGELIALDLDPSIGFSKSRVAKDCAKQWEERYYGEQLWTIRKAWFKKPFALLHAPFQKGIWIDLDCEILGSLLPLFSHCNAQTPIALVREYPADPLAPLSTGAIYNGGVIAFTHGASLIQAWADSARDSSHLFLSDDRLLSHLIEKHKAPIAELDPIYNWTIGKGLNLNAVIMHWMGAGGKELIRDYGGLKPLLDRFYRSCGGNE